MSAPTLRELAPWTTAPCDMCGCEHQASRTMRRVIEAGGQLLCAGCEGYVRGEARGRESGAERMARAMVAALYWRAGEADLVAAELRLVAVTWAVGALRAVAEDAGQRL